MSEIDRLTFEIKKYGNRTDISDKDKITGLKALEDVIADATAKVMSGKTSGVFVNCTSETALSDPPIQLLTIPGIILRDEPTKEVVGPGEWMPMLVENKGNVGLAIPGVGIVAEAEGNGTYYIGTEEYYTHATTLTATIDNAERHLANHNLYNYHLATKHNITAEVADDVSYKNYALFHLCHITDGDDFFDTCIWTTQRRAKECYESYVASEIPCSLCGILPKSGVPVLLKSYDPNAEETKP